MSDSTPVDLHEQHREFMGLTPEQRDDVLWFTHRQLKDLLVNSKLISRVEKMDTLMHGTEEKAGLSIRFNELEKVVKSLVRSNARLQAALYICTGAWLAVRFYFQFIAPLMANHP